MFDISYLSAFLIGLAGGVHCIGMCGGIASAFTFAVPSGHSHGPYIACYNIGRIFSYTVAGGISGYAGSIVSTSFASGLAILQVLSITFLLLLSLYISDLYKGLSHFERLGASLWRHLSPFTKRLIPFKSPFHTLLYGAIWGWLPCGLVYSALAWSMSSGTTFEGALLMLCFGLGTLPALIASSMGAGFIQPLLQRKASRIAIAVVLFLFALFLTFQFITGIKWHL